MAGAFSVGSIVAKLKADDSEFTKQLKETTKKAKIQGDSLGKAIAAAVQRQTQKTKVLDETKTKRTFNTVLKQAKLFSARVATTLARVGKVGLVAGLKATGVAMAATFKSIRISIAAAATAVRRAGLVMRSVFQRLRRSVFGLQGMFAALGVSLGTLALIRRADEIGSLSTAFANLTRFVGATADAMLAKLQVATRSTVSDLELMRTTNNAVLLGVVKSSDQFAELATVARRLGRAVGKDTVQAINDLATGIGRQSRLILDNLGLIVKVGEATERYSRQIGKTADQLTDAERRQAFLNATMDAARKKVRELGPDTVSLSDHWGRFTAAISNTATTLAKVFIGQGSVFGEIGMWLQENQNQIAAYTRFITRTISNFASNVFSTVRGTFSAGSLDRLAREIGDLISDLIEFILEASAKTLLKGIEAIFSNLGGALFKLVAALFAQVGNQIVTRIQTLIVRASKAVLNAVLALPQFGSPMARLLGVDTPEKYEQKLKKIESLASFTMGMIEDSSRERADAITDIVEGAVDDIGAEVSELADKVVKEMGETKFTQPTNRFYAAWASTFDSVGVAFRQLQLELADPFAAFSTLEVQREIANLGKEFSSIIRLQHELQRAAPDLITVQQVKDSGRRLQEIKDQIVSVNKAYGELKTAPLAAQKVLKEKFVAAITELQRKLKDASSETIAFVESVMKQKDATMFSVDAMKELRSALSGVVEEAQQMGAGAEQALLGTVDALVAEADASKATAVEMSELRRQLAATVEVFKLKEQRVGAVADVLIDQLAVSIDAAVDGMIEIRREAGEDTKQIEGLRTAFLRSLEAYRQQRVAVAAGAGASGRLRAAILGSVDAAIKQAEAAGLSSERTALLRLTIEETLNAFDRMNRSGKASGASFAFLKRHLASAITELLDIAEAAGEGDKRFQQLRRALLDLIKTAAKDVNRGEALERALQPRFFDPEAFAKLLEPFQQQLPKLRLEIETLGLEGAEKEMAAFLVALKGVLDPPIKNLLEETGASFDQFFGAVLDKLDPESRQRVVDFRNEFEALLQQRDNIKGAIEAEKALKQMEMQLGQLQDQAAVTGGEMLDLGRKFNELDRQMDRLKERVPTEAFDKLREKADEMKEAMARQEIGKYAAQYENLRWQLRVTAGEMTEQEVRIKFLETAFLNYEATLLSLGTSSEKVDKAIRDMRKTITSLQEVTAFAPFEEALKSFREEIADTEHAIKKIGMTDLEQELADIDRKLTEAKESSIALANAFIAMRIAAGASAEEIAWLQYRLDQYVNSLEDNAKKQQDLAAERAKATEIEEEAKAWGRIVSESVLGGIYDAFSRGEKLSKAWARITADFFRREMNKALNWLSDKLKVVFEEIFKSAGWGAAIGNVISGLIGIAGAIYQHWRSKSTSTVEDFSEAINSSEAVRGVVAGPTNVAISKIGDSLKQAMRTSEILLERIAIDIESGGFGGASGGGAPLHPNAVLPLTPSTAT